MKYCKGCGNGAWGQMIQGYHLICFNVVLWREAKRREQRAANHKRGTEQWSAKSAGNKSQKAITSRS
jgi:hypothetical protein